MGYHKENLESFVEKLNQAKDLELPNTSPILIKKSLEFFQRFNESIIYDITLAKNLEKLKKNDCADIEDFLERSKLGNNIYLGNGSNGIETDDALIIMDGLNHDHKKSGHKYFITLCSNYLKENTNKGEYSLFIFGTVELSDASKELVKFCNPLISLIDKKTGFFDNELSCINTKDETMNKKIRYFMASSVNHYINLATAIEKHGYN